MTGGTDGPSGFYLVMFRLFGTRGWSSSECQSPPAAACSLRSAWDAARLEQANAEHSRIIEALRARDVDLAAALTREHIRLATRSAASKTRG